MRLLEYKTDNSIRAFSTMRGEGAGNYAGFNITHYCGDTPEHVAECRRELCFELGIDDCHLVLPRQTHSDHTVEINEWFLKQSREKQAEFLHGADAIITAITGVCIGVSTADCIPLLLHDRERGVIAAIHAGWRGTVARIVEKCIAEMHTAHGCNAKNINAIIGPGISLNAFEVGNEVYEEFAANGFEMECISGLYPTADGNRKWHIDLWEANRLQLMECGIDEKSIEVAGICTYKNHAEFFSARRLGIKSGRIFSGIMMK